MGHPGSAATAPLSDAAYRQQVVDAARAEGQVNATLHTSWTPEGIQRVEDAIEREFGVRIKVNYQPIINYVQRASELFGEAQANVTPSFDLYQSADTTAGMLSARRRGRGGELGGAAAGGDAAPHDRQQRAAPGRVHRPLRPDDRPRADPRCRRAALDQGPGQPPVAREGHAVRSTNTYLPWVIRLGREETLAALRAAVQNGAIADTFPAT